MYALLIWPVLFFIVVCGNCTWRTGTRVGTSLALLPLLGIIFSALSSGNLERYYYVAVPLAGVCIGIVLFVRWVTTEVQKEIRT